MWVVPIVTSDSLSPYEFVNPYSINALVGKLVSNEIASELTLGWTISTLGGRFSVPSLTINWLEPKCFC